MTATKKSLASLKETKATAEGDLTVTSKELAEDEDTKAGNSNDNIIYDDSNNASNNHG